MKYLVGVNKDYDRVLRGVSDASDALSVYRRALAPEIVLGQFYAEVLDRLGQLERLTELIRDEHCQFVRMLDRHVRRPKSCDASKLAEIGERMRLYVESWYYFAFRVKTAVNNAEEFPGMGGFNPPGVRQARNHLLEHRPPGDEPGNFGVDVEFGLYLGSGRTEGKFPDAGFLPNAMQFFSEFIGALGNAPARVLPSSVNRPAFQRVHNSTRAEGAQRAVRRTTVAIESKPGSSVLTIPETTTEMDGARYRCIVSSERGIVVSMTAVLTVLPDNTPDRGDGSVD